MPHTSSEAIKNTSKGKTMAIARLTRKQKKERKFAAVKKYALSEKLVDSIEECNKLNKALKKQIKGTNFEYEYELQKDIEKSIKTQVKKHHQALLEIQQYFEDAPARRIEDENIIDYKIAAYIDKGTREFGDANHFMAELRAQIPDKELRDRVLPGHGQIGPPHIPDREKPQTEIGNI